MIAAYCKFCKTQTIVIAAGIAHLNVAVLCKRCAAIHPDERAYHEMMRANQQAILHYFRATGWVGDDEFNKFLQGTLDGLSAELKQRLDGTDEQGEWR